VKQENFLIIGANGQLGKALQAKYPKARAVDINELNIADQKSVDSFDWSDVKVILNAAAYTNVDGAETPEGKEAARQANTVAVENLAKVAKEKDLAIVHISTDYVFDGTKDSHKEDEPFSPINVYGQTKAEGDTALADVPKHYILRTSWVIGDGKNFVRTMLELGKKGVNPEVVNDQIGRLTFTSTLVKAIDHLLTTHAPYGTYNVTNDGEPASWAEITQKIFEYAGLPNTVTGITTEEYYKGKEDVAPRPLQSTLDLSKIKATGYYPRDWQEDLNTYIKKETS
jgi:dTDP-4-dehydrorhamnose reductase